MENLLGMLGVKECTSDFNKEFLLKDNDNFSDEEMKEMEKCIGENYIAGNKVLFNGKIKLTYREEKLCEVFITNASMPMQNRE